MVTSRARPIRAALLARRDAATCRGGAGSVPSGAWRAPIMTDRVRHIGTEEQLEQRVAAEQRGESECGADEKIAQRARRWWLGVATQRGMHVHEMSKGGAIGEARESSTA